MIGATLKGSLLVATLAFLPTGCASQGNAINDHWNARSVPPRVARFFLGYDSSTDGEYRDFAWARKQDINLTLRRHFLHQNPDNPNHIEWEGRYAERPNHSLLPNPLYYIHLEGILIGAAIYGASGSFVPIPVDSIIGTFQPGGFDEFWAGVAEGFSPIGVVTSSILGGGDLDEDGETSSVSTVTNLIVEGE